ncbi:MAG: hypothetical protein M3R15_31410 [Acidobacteriota bacterium]|nr:hypothetical protein [Acidobacteriota bacterium]
MAFQVIDFFYEDSARGDYIGIMPGVVRPVVDWTTHFQTGNETNELLFGKVTTA